MMKKMIWLLWSSTCCWAQHGALDYEAFQFPSRLEGKKLNLLYTASRKTDSRGAVIFVHGSSFPSKLSAGFRIRGVSWMDVMADTGFDVFALDFLGYGESDRYDHMVQDDKVDDVPNGGRVVVRDLDIAVDLIRKQLGIDRVVLLGHSWGGTVAGHYATLYPEKVDRLVLFAPIVQRLGPTDRKPIRSLFLEQTPEQRLEQFKGQVPEDEDMVLEQDVLLHWGKAWVKSDPTARARNTGSVRYPSDWQMDLYDCWNGNCFLNPGSLRVPTLIVRGEWDTAFSARDAEMLFDHMVHVDDKSYVVVGRGTHVLHLEENRWALFNEVLTFIKNEKR
ncbi:alpha/beta fold hydrolase [Muricauda sp. NFXS6]|uniref:alpha/beta hydrolase n=1 Tax=Allomuricauda sp. NFXS6 TaxID=2819094 RepID=UPI0032DF5128